MADRPRETETEKDPGTDKKKKKDQLTEGLKQTERKDQGQFGQRLIEVE